MGKLFLFDLLDISMVELVPPNFSWALRYQVVLILVAVAILWLALGSRRFFLAIGFVLGYFLVWGKRILGYLVPRWETYLFLVPIFVATARYFRETFVLYVLLLAGGLAVLVSDSQLGLWFAGLVILSCLLWHYWLVVYRTYWNRPFEVAARFAADAGKKMGSGKVPTAVTTIPQKWRGYPRKRERTPMGFVGVSYLAEIFAQWFEEFSRGRRFELLLPLAFLRTLLLTLLVFAGLYIAAYGINASSFAGHADPGPVTFIAFSFDRLFASDSTTVRPVSAIAKVLANAQAATTVLIFVFFVFLFFSTQRDLTKEDLEELAVNLRQLADTARSQAKAALGQPFEVLELEAFRESPQLVNNWRQRTGRSELKSKRPD